MRLGSYVSNSCLKSFINLILAPPQKREVSFVPTKSFHSKILIIQLFEKLRKQEEFGTAKEVLSFVVLHQVREWSL